MRKFFVSLLFCGMFFEVYAATYNCKVQDIGMFSFKMSNEYLFVNTADYNHSNGRALVCGHMSTDGCDDNTMVYVTGHHYHGNIPRTDAWFYRCSSRGGNSWDAVGSTGFSRCSSIDGMRVITTVGSNDIYVPESEYVEYVSSGYYVSNKFCFLPHADGNKRDERKQNACDGLSEPLKSECEKCSRDGTGARWNDADKKCQCLDNTKMWSAEQGRCVAKGGKGGKDGKDNKDDKDDNIIKPSNCISTFSSLQTMIDTYCVDLKVDLSTYMTLCNNGQMTVENFNAIYSNLSERCNVIIERNKANNEQAKQKLVTAAEKLDTMFAKFEVSKWKNEEGEFNTARLASDSIAGVVLGTTGGLITSSVMKKKQVEQGLEDLRCVVGGQSVAGWGDEFMVGIQ